MGLGHHGLGNHGPGGHKAWQSLGLEIIGAWCSLGLRPASAAPSAGGRGGVLRLCRVGRRPADNRVTFCTTTFADGTILTREEASMARVLISGFAICLVASAGWAQVDSQQVPDSRTVLGGGNELLAAGAELIRAGEYEDGIRLTTLGLDRSPSIPDKAAALSNLCAAHAARGDPDRAITFCTESIAINEQELARVQQPLVRVLFERHVRPSELGSRIGGVDQPERAAGGADTRHDQRAQSAPERDHGGPPLTPPPE